MQHVLILNLAGDEHVQQAAIAHLGECTVAPLSAASFDRLNFGPTVGVLVIWAKGAQAPANPIGGRSAVIRLDSSPLPPSLASARYSINLTGDAEHDGDALRSVVVVKGLPPALPRVQRSAPASVAAAPARVAIAPSVTPRAPRAVSTTFVRRRSRFADIGVIFSASAAGTMVAVAMGAATGGDLLAVSASADSLVDGAGSNELAIHDSAARAQSILASAEFGQAMAAKEFAPISASEVDQMRARLAQSDEAFASFRANTEGSLVRLRDLAAAPPVTSAPPMDAQAPVVAASAPIVAAAPAQAPSAPTLLVSIEPLTHPVDLVSEYVDFEAQQPLAAGPLSPLPS